MIDRLKYLFEVVRNCRFVVLSYSQCGEDNQLKKYFFDNLPKQKFYVDVGCYHPKRISNTFYFYNRGWSGINIDINPKSIEKFEKERKRDINLHMGIANKRGTMGLVEGDGKDMNKLGGKGNVPVLPLREVFVLYGVVNIDFLSIDVDGLDFEVLKSNDWDRWKPQAVCVENRDNTKKIDLFLKKMGYYKWCQTYLSAIYVIKGVK